MEEKQKKRWKFWRFALLAAVLLTAAGAVYGYCGYKGYILLNHPSRLRYPVRGVDVSHYQGDIDWSAFERQGIEFAYIKATEGSGMVDDRFWENWDKAREAGIKAGAYHFFSFDSPAQRQFENFVRAVPAYREMLPPTVDFEFYGDKKNNPPDPAATREQLSILLDSLEARYGVKPMIYAARDTWELYLKGHFDEYPLWIRSIVTRPRIGGNKWTIWQYANRGRLEGYTGGEKFIDLNAFCGSREAWEEWSGSYSRAMDARGTLAEMDGFGLLISKDHQIVRQNGRMIVTRELSKDSYRMQRLKISSHPIPDDLGELPLQRSAWCLKMGMDLTSGLPMRVSRYPMPGGDMAYRAVDIRSGDWATAQIVWFFFGRDRIYAVEEADTTDNGEVMTFSKMIRQGRVFLDGKTVLIDEENAPGVLWQETVGGDGALRPDTKKRGDGAPRPETKARENNLLWLETEARGDGGLELRIYSENGLAAAQPVNTFSCGSRDVRVWVDKDVNFDGYHDIQIMEGDTWHIYLWDPEQGQFRQELDYGPMLRPETDAGFSLDSEQERVKLHYNDRNGFNGNGAALAEWRGDRLMLPRMMEFPQSPGDDPDRAFPVRVVDFPEGRELDGPFYSDEPGGGQMLFEAQWTKEEYEEKREAVEAVFYRDLPFKGDFARSLWAGDVFYDQSRIPESFRNYLKSAMEAGNEKEALLAIRESVELTPPQVKALAAENPDLDWWVREIASSPDGAAVFVEADGDGDGIGDISAEIYLGGTGGFTQFVFFKGQGDGSYRETSDYSHVKEEFAYVSWEGRSYLVRTGYDYGAKLYDGFSVYAYEDGKRAGALRLALEPEGFSVETEEARPGYEAMAEKISAAGLSAALDTGAWPYEPKVTLGSGETEVGEGIYSSDVFNTGEPVEYDKYNWYSSNMYTRDGVASSLFAKLPPIQWSDFTGDVVMFWVEAAEDKNVICFLERDGLMDYAVSGWRYEGEQAENVFRVKWTGVRSIKEQPLQERSGV